MSDWKTLCQPIEKALSEAVSKEGVDPRLNEAMRYSLLAGGKRIRPTLTLLAAQLLNVPQEEAMFAACAVEMVHTYSLIHDDLPAMDDDSLRRGRPTNHVVYGEAMAILAGDALLTEAFLQLYKGAEKYPCRASGYLRGVGHLAHFAGKNGMVAGQTLDMQNERGADPAKRLHSIHANKTAALLQAALLCGLELGTPTEEQRRSIEEYGLHLGLAFQAQDDILDSVATPEQLGKTPGKDLTQGKLTCLSVYTLPETEAYAAEQTRAALAALSVWGEKAAALYDITKKLEIRKN